MSQMTVTDNVTVNVTDSATGNDTAVQTHSPLTGESERETRAGVCLAGWFGNSDRPEPEKERIAHCYADGADSETVEAEIEQFIAWHNDRGSWSPDWDSAWIKWWARWRERTKAEKPRQGRAGGPRQPKLPANLKELEAAAAMFAKGQLRSHQLGRSPVANLPWLSAMTQLTSPELSGSVIYREVSN
jgi:hypothetical protein